MNNANMKLNNTPPIMINNRCHAGLAGTPTVALVVASVRYP